jgi:hypothetical protein
MTTETTKPVKHPLIRRFAEAYMAMAQQAHYRPATPGDGCGGINLSAQQFRDPQRLSAEAQDYAVEFLEEEQQMRFRIGCSDFRTNRALVYTIEAARLLCGGLVGDLYAIKLLNMALTEIKTETKSKRRAGLLQ